MKELPSEEELTFYPALLTQIRVCLSHTLTRPGVLSLLPQTASQFRRAPRA
jgi:hypothetical protein